MWSPQYSDEDEDACDVSQSQDAIRERDEYVDNDPGLKVVEGEGLTEEMNAMKEVFMRMSEKKVRQKEQGQRDCVRVYSEAFQSDVERIFTTSKKSCIAEAQKLNESIEQTSTRLEEQKKELMHVQESYECSFRESIENVTSELERLKELRAKVVDAYELGKHEVVKAFEEAFGSVDTMTSRLQGHAAQIYSDTSYVKAFQSQVERLM
ncbi:hypothetical protein DYB34_006632 [Aphanomyces astaci]|uniref:Uncharacterized protein n=1 Tax=Aphanomyces astaci TaxID=112090 RepID=A0A418C1Z1_APHAT|nr:hypothetical protein DYB34_006632 [Aphanomyces astaci]